MKEVILSLIGVVIGAIITYVFNIFTERKKLQNKIYIEIYEKTIKNIDKASKSAKDIKLLMLSKELERQYRKPNNYADELDKIHLNVKNNLKTIQLKINDLIDLNLHFNYHRIPLNKHGEKIDNINKKSFKIMDNTREIENLYKSTVTSIENINISDEVWDNIIQKEQLLEENINEYMKEIMLFSSDIQNEYYRDLLKIR